MTQETPEWVKAAMGRMRQVAAEVRHELGVEDGAVCIKHRCLLKTNRDGEWYCVGCNGPQYASDVPNYEQYKGAP